MYNIIGKSEWFKRRKYGGWGIRPKTWQGWIYIAALIGSLILFQSLPFWTSGIRLIGTLLWTSFVLVDTTHIMMNIEKSDLERKIEAFSERNAAWFMIAILIIGVLYDVMRSVTSDSFEVNIFLLIALVGGAVIKSVSNYYYESKGL